MVKHKVAPFLLSSAVFFQSLFWGDKHTAALFLRHSIQLNLSSLMIPNLNFVILDLP